MTNPNWHQFEDEVFDIVSRMAIEGDLHVNPERVKPKRMAKYYSEQRKAEIEFEVSLEVFSEGASEPSNVWLWECKDRSRSKHKVEAKDVEALRSKVEQLGPGRFAASLVTTHGFQSAALNLAVSSGISLFTLQKKLVRVTQFSRDAREAVMMVPTVTDGVSLGGQKIAGCALDEAIMMCIEEMEGAERVGPADAVPRRSIPAEL